MSHSPRLCVSALISVLFALLLPVGVAGAAAPAAELITDTPVLAPSTTLELRFAKAMVEKAAIGVPVAQSPIVITPNVEGTFTWLSTSSGVFAPKNAWPIGNQFRVTLRPGLKAADGKALSGDFQGTLTSPNFQQTAVESGVYDVDNIPVSPRVRVAYNLAVELKGLAALCQFVDAGGKKIAATVSHATGSDYFNLKPEQEDWNERWRLAHEAPKPETEEEQEDAAKAKEPQPNRIFITPVEPLGPGAAWHLEIRPGVKARTGKHQTAAPLIVPLGRVKAFDVTVEPSSYIHSGRSVALNFSHSLAPDITPETATKFFRITPAVPNLRFEDGDATLTVRGDFEQGRDYRLEILPEVVSEDGLAFQGERTRPFRFKPVAPRLYLPTITGHQTAGGRRKFDVLAANLKSVRVTAKRVAPAHAAMAVEAFKKYERVWDEGEPKPEDVEELYRPVPAGLIQGKVIYDKTLVMPERPLDTRQQLTLDWSEIVGSQLGGVLFLSIEGEPHPEIGGRRPAAQALVQLTDFGVLWKTTDEGLKVTVFSMATGRAQDAVEVSLLDAEFKEFRRGNTNADGDVILPMSAQPAWLLVSKGADLHVMRIGDEAQELPMAAFQVPLSYGAWGSPDPQQEVLQVRAFIFTDRPLYRPGETVRIKGIVRSVLADGLKPTPNLEGLLKLRDSKGRDAGEIKVVTDARGAFDSAMVLNGALVGGHSLQLSFPAHNVPYSSGLSCRFEVADYQPNAFELNVAIPPRIGPGAEVSAKVSAQYLFGAPLTKAIGRWTLRYAREVFSPEGFGSWSFTDADGSEGKALTLRGEGAIGPDGLVVQPQLPAIKGGAHRGVFTVEVTDLNQQTVSESRLFARDSADFYLGASIPDGHVVRAGGELEVRAIAIRPDGQPVPDPVEVKAEFLHDVFETVRLQGAGKAITFRSETNERLIGSATGRSLPVGRDGEGWKVAPGATAKFKPEKAGQYRVRLTAKDQAGRTTSCVLRVYVSGPHDMAWDFRNPAQVDLVADKPQYQPGDTARLLVKTPISGEALVSIEREHKILRTMRVRLEGNAPMIEIPLEKGDAPNVFVSVVLLRGQEQSTKKFKTPEYRYGLTMLSVTDPVARLEVAVVPVRKEVQPGDDVEVDVTVVDGAGAMVKDAEVTFFAADDGILALTGYERPMPRTIFGAPFHLSVRTGLSLYQLLAEDPADLEFSNKGYLIGGGGLEGPGMKLRRDFPGTACWFPTLRTDAKGRVRATFKAPDAITRYRLVAVAHAAGNLFGSGESAFAIRKPLILLPALGSFANLNDELVARVVVRNETGAKGVASVSLELDGKGAPARPGADPLVAKVSLANGEARAVDFPVKIRALGDAEWKWKATIEADGKEYHDQVVSSFTVGSTAPLLRETYLPGLSAASSALLAGVNPQLLEGTGSVTVTVSNTRLSSLREGVRQILEYPYGCAEQTISTLIPWALMPELEPVMPGLSNAEAGEAIAKGLQRLFSMQTGGGGITMWPGSQTPSLFVSSYAVVACTILQKQGIALPPGHEDLLKYISEELRGLPAIRSEQLLGERALALFALATAGKAEPAYHEALFRRRQELSHESRALLAMAILDANGAPAMVEELLRANVSAPESLSWFGGAARERAVQLMAWSRFQPRSDEVARLVKELLGYRANGHWGTTQSNAWALLGLARYYTAVEGKPKPSAGSLSVGAKDIPFRLNKETPAATHSFAIDPNVPLSGIEVRNPTKATLFGETQFVVRASVADQPAQNRGYAVSRSYRKLADDGTLKDAVGLKVGDRVVVSLRVETVRPGHFVAIDDPLPAILEAVNPAFQSREVGGGDALVRDGVSDYSETRSDRVLYFCDHLPAGAYNFSYLARVRTAGSVTAGATKVEEMYRPERFGLGTINNLESAPADR